MTLNRDLCHRKSVASAGPFRITFELNRLKFESRIGFSMDKLRITWRISRNELSYRNESDFCVVHFYKDSLGVSNAINSGVEIEIL